MKIAIATLSVMALTAASPLTARADGLEDLFGSGGLFGGSGAAGGSGDMSGADSDSESSNVVKPERPLGAGEYGITGVKKSGGQTTTGGSGAGAGSASSGAEESSGEYESEFGQSGSSGSSSMSGGLNSVSDSFMNMFGGGGNTGMSQTFSWRGGEFGHRVSGDDGSMKNTSLMSVSSGGQSIRTYCADEHTPVRKDFGSVSYLESAVQNKSKMGQVGWIVKNSYPAVSLDQLSQVAGAKLSKSDAIAASQSAVWHYTNGFNLRKVSAQTFIGGLDIPLLGGLGGGSGQTGVMNLYKHLITNAASQTNGSANTLGVKVTESSFSKGLVGPIVITGDAQSTVTAQVSGGTLVDAAGKAIDLSKIPVNEKLYLKVTQNSGSANISVAGTVKVNAGRIFTGAHGVNTQAQVGVDTYTRPDKATGTVKWNSGGTTAGQNGGEDVPPTTTTPTKPGGKTTTITTPTGSKQCDDSKKTATTADDCLPESTSGEECDSNKSTPSTADDCEPPKTTGCDSNKSTPSTDDDCPPAKPKGCDDSNATATTSDDCPMEPKILKPIKRIPRTLADTGAGGSRS